MYTQNLAHKFSGNSSWSYQKYLFQVHVFAFFSEAQCLIPSYKTQCYLKTTLNSYERTKPVGKLLRGRLLLSKLAVTLPNPHKNVDTSTEDGQKGNEGGRHQPACGLVWIVWDSLTHTSGCCQANWCKGASSGTVHPCSMWSLIFQRLAQASSHSSFVVPKSSKQKHQGASTSQASACLTFTNVPLVNTSQDDQAQSQYERT